MDTCAEEDQEAVAAQCHEAINGLTMEHGADFASTFVTARRRETPDQEYRAFVLRVRREEPRGRAARTRAASSPAPR